MWHPAESRLALSTMESTDETENEKKYYHNIIHERGDVVIQRFTASSLVNVCSVKEKAANALIEKTL
jgi:hypothetical protein